MFWRIDVAPVCQRRLDRLLQSPLFFHLGRAHSVVSSPRAASRRLRLRSPRAPSLLSSAPAVPVPVLAHDPLNFLLRHARHHAQLPEQTFHLFVFSRVALFPITVSLHAVVDTGQSAPIPVVVFVQCTRCRAPTPFRAALPLPAVPLREHPRLLSLQRAKRVAKKEMFVALEQC